MAGIGGLSSSTYTAASQLPGFGGLASGLDRDTLIEQMTYGTRAKIAKMNQKIDLVEWEQESIRGLTDKMYDFSNRYMSYGSGSTNLTSSLLFSKSRITAVGENSSLVSVSGNAAGKEMFSVVGVRQLAQNARLTNGSAASDRTLRTGTIDFVNGQTFSSVKGDSITFSVGKDSSEQTYKLTISDTSADGKTHFDLTTAEGVKDAVNDALKNDEALKKLNIEASVSGNRLSFKNNGENNVTIKSGTGDILNELGFEVNDDKKLIIESGGNYLTASEDAVVTTTENMADLMKDTELVFSYNGKTEKITFTEEDIKGLTDAADADSYKNMIQEKLDEAFGTGRIRVDTEGSGPEAMQLTFRTMNPGDGSEDGSSVLKITGGSASLIGENGALGIVKGESNRINMSGTLESEGLIPSGQADPDREFSITINGEEFKFSRDTSVSEMMDEINSNTKAGVTISYQELSDKFTISSNQSGASGKVEISGELAESIFGAGEKTEHTDGYVTQKGQDAIVSIQYAGSSDTIDIVRDTNGFSLDGMEVSVRGTFGDYSQGSIKADPKETVTFEATIDSEKTLNVVRDMVKDFNEIVELVNKELNTKPNRDYPPLTDEQRKEMSEDEIEKWEKKAKEGMLFNDSDIRGLANALRFVLPAGDRQALAEIGITVSKEYSDNGKIILDEEKFKTALEKDPQKVRELFNGAGDKESKGLMGNMKAAMDRYAITTGSRKGILIQRAGSSHAPTSMLQNNMLNQINEMKRAIDDLNAMLKNEQDRYIKQFTTLETLIGQMNSQSSYLASMAGGY